MRLAWAFFKRDAAIALSYRAAFLAQFGGNFLILGVFYYVGRTIGTQQIPALAAYGGNFLAFLLIGFALADCVGVSLTTFATQIREGQTTGTLEITLMAPLSLPVILLCSSLWSYFYSALRLLIYLVLGGLFYGVNFGHADIFSALVILFLTVIAFMGIGIAWAAVIMIIKRGEGILMLLSYLVILLSGVLFPVTVLPSWMRSLSFAVPLTHALSGMRFALLKGATLHDLRQTILILTAFAATFMIGGSGLFQYAVNIAKKTGSLTQY